MSNNSNNAIGHNASGKMVSGKNDPAPISPSAFTFAILPWDHPSAAELRQAQVSDILTEFPHDIEPGTAPSASDVPVFIVATHTSTGAAVGCGGLRPLNDIVAGDVVAEGDSNDGCRAVEIKRMYVVPEFRGKGWGLAGRLLGEIEREAWGRGWWDLRLETAGYMAAARGFYEREGYGEIECFVGYKENAHSVCYGKDLRKARGCVQI